MPDSAAMPGDEAVEVPTNPALLKAWLQAAIHGKLGTLISLADAGVSLELCEGAGWTALALAAWWGYTECMQELLRRGAHIEAADKNAWTPYHHACYGGHVSSVELLVNKGCDVAAREKDGKTGRALASAEGHAALLAKLEEWHVPELDEIQPEDPPLQGKLKGKRKGKGDELWWKIWLGSDMANPTLVDPRCYQIVMIA